MIVVVILGLMAAMAAQSYQKLKNRSEVSRAANDLRVFAEAFERYAMERGAWPDDVGPGEVPEEMEGYFRDARWSSRTSLGGNFDWDSGVFGYTAGISIADPTATTTALLLLDEVVDDGSLTSGRLRQRSGGVAYILEF
jgi:type II secretory pathway pseudopilin PulG